MLFLQDCTLEDSTYTKDLKLVDKDLSKVVILDNSPAAYKHFTGKTTKEEHLLVKTFDKKNLSTIIIKICLYINETTKI